MDFDILSQLCDKALRSSKRESLLLEHLADISKLWVTRLNNYEQAGLSEQAQVMRLCMNDLFALMQSVYGKTDS